VAWRDLRAIEEILLALAEAHRDTLMAGRTHGQPGSPISFGYKAAGWADEVRRHLDRLKEAGPRLFAGQLGGGVVTLAFFGSDGVELRRRFCGLLGLETPAISWTSSRDRPAELVHLLAMVTATLARVGNEVYQLSRPEIGELAETPGPGVVGSITMPHKRNPEIAEHLVTLSRLVRAQQGVVLEGMVAEGERDGRGWKAEWAAVPEACLLAGAALDLAKRMLAGLEVHPEAMRGNLGAMAASEKLLAALAPSKGKHATQDVLQRALAAGGSLEEAASAAGLNGSDLLAPDAGAAGAMVDEVVRRARAARASEPEVWP
jgi:adenylosuccinate lyase